MLKAEAGGLVQPMLAGGVEVLIGVIQEPVFGPLVVLGLGGTATEVLGDHAARPAVHWCREWPVGLCAAFR